MGGADAEQAGRGEVRRRRFFARAIGFLAAPWAVVLGGSLAASLIGPVYRKPKPSFFKVEGFDKAPEGQPVKLHCPLTRMDAYLRQDVLEDVWVIKHSPTLATVFSPVCTHLGCRYDFEPGAKRFVCACHNSVFSVTGERLSGPAPRPLDTLPYKIEGGVLWVEWESFEPGVPLKVRIG